MEVTKEQIIEMMRTAYLCGHQDTVDGNVAYCEQGSREVCEDIFESDFEQSQETRPHETIVICPLCEEPCDFDAHENGYFWAGCNTCNTYASSFSVDELRQRLRRNTEARMGK